MGFEDRDYYRDGPSGPGVGLARVGHWLLHGRVPLFRAFGIDVQAHSSLLIAMAFTLLFLGNGYTWQDGVISAGLLFLIVLLHELGHCFGARWAGGEADQIVMHPLGGLALTQPPSNWQGHFVTTACGPLVNVAICLVCGVALYTIKGRIPWQPFYLNPWEHFDGWLDTSWLLYWIYQTSWTLLLFNLLPIYPLDGGRMTQEVLWSQFGYYRSMLIASTTGLVAAIVAGMVALATGQVGLVILAALGAMMCANMRRQLREMGPYGFSEYDDPFAAAMQRARRENRRDNRRASRGPSRATRKLVKRQEAARQSEAADEAEIDRILAKVSASGMHSLSRSEQKTLKRATQRQQARDAARR